jgi:hypothetical protein
VQLTELPPKVDPVYARFVGVPVLTVIVAEPTTELDVAVRVFDPAAYRVADSAVVLTPPVKDTEVTG